VSLAQKWARLFFATINRDKERRGRGEKKDSSIKIRLYFKLSK
jgi:hypothetical protein